MSLFASSISAGTTKDGQPAYQAADLIVVLYDDHLLWDKGILGKESANIYYTDIISVTYSNGNFVSNGHISVSTAGRNYTAKMVNEYRNLNIIAEAIEAKCHEAKENASRKNSPQPSVFSAAEELKQCKELLDLGIISQEEFDRKKEAFLNRGIQDNPSQQSPQSTGATSDIPVVPAKPKVLPVGRVIEGYHSGCKVFKLVEKNVLFLYTKDGSKIPVSRKNTVSIDDVTDQYSTNGAKVLKVMWNDASVSVIQFGRTESKV